jgi:hypothetical protein
MKLPNQKGVEKMKKIKKIQLLSFWDNSLDERENWIRISRKFKEYETLVIVDSNCYFFNKELRSLRDVLTALETEININKRQELKIIYLDVGSHYYNKVTIN